MSTCGARRSGLTVLPCAGDRAQPLPERVAQRGELRRLAPGVGERVRLAHPDRLMRRERARSEAVLLLAAVHLRRERDAGADVERPDALRPANLVRGERAEVDREEPTTSGTLPALCAAST